MQSRAIKQALAPYLEKSVVRCHYEICRIYLMPYDQPAGEDTLLIGTAADFEAGSFLGCSLVVSGPCPLKLERRCERQNCNLFVVREGHSVSGIYNHLANLLYALQQWQGRLAALPQTPSRLLRAAAERWGASVLLLDGDGVVSYWVGPFQNAQGGWLDYLRVISPELGGKTAFRLARVLDALKNPGADYLIDGFESCQYLFFPLRTVHGEAGILLVVLQGRTASFNEISLMQELALALGRLPPDAWRPHTGSFDRFLERVLDGQPVSADEMKSGLDAFGWRSDHSYFLFCIRMQKENGSSRRLRELGLSLESRMCNTRFCIKERAVYLVVNRSLGHMISLEECIRKAAPLLEDAPAWAGSSNSLDSFDRLPQACIQAEWAILLGRVFLPGQRFWSYPSVVIFHMLHRCDRGVNLNMLIHPAVQKLFRYDEEYHTQYAETLRAYLSAALKMKEAAETLHIHKNTLTYRLEKISGIVDLHMKEPESVFQYQLSFRIMDYLGHQRQLQELVKQAPFLAEEK